MFASQYHRLDFADTRTSSHTTCADSVFSHPAFSRFEVMDPLEQMAQADAADRSLLRLVACAALATLLLAVASSFGA